MNPAKSSPPLKRFATATTVTCATAAKVYGQCILASYQDVKKDMCQKEFLAFKECVQTTVSITMNHFAVKAILNLGFLDEAQMVILSRVASHGTGSSQ
jgi:NADH dehydrogenase [ubiquinone] 1 alpha subcomplex assembly factor 8